MKKVTKIRILFVIWTLEGMGGSEKVVYDIVRKLDRHIFDPLLLSFEDGPIREAYESIGVDVFVIKKGSKFDIPFFKQIRKLILKEKIDIVNAHHYYPMLYSYIAALNTGIRLVFTEHSVWQFLEAGLFKKLIIGWLLRKTDAIVAISEQLVRYYLSRPFLDKSKLRDISNGIDMTWFKKSNHLALKKNLGYRKGDKLIGIIANIRPEKNHKLLIKAFSILEKQIGNLHLVVAGIDLMGGEVQRFAESQNVADKIKFLGKREDIPDLLNIFDAFCLPSVHEGLPLTVLEAMACGTPIIGSNVLGINEVIRHGENGLLFEANDENDLAGKLKQILVDETLREKLTRNGTAFVKENYDLDKKIIQYETLFLQQAQ